MPPGWFVPRTGQLARPVGPAGRVLVTRSGDREQTAMAESIERDGSRLVDEVAGGSDPPILFAHGWSCDRSYFAPQVEHLGQWHAVATVDLRGHGASSSPSRARASTRSLR
jgi:pimeloyl-ACP methyl ester carboxylesterase